MDLAHKTIEDITFNMLPKEVRDAIPAFIRDELERRDTLFMKVDTESLANMRDAAERSVDLAAWQREIGRIAFEAIVAMARYGVEMSANGNGQGIMSTLAHIATMCDPDQGVVSAIADAKTRSAIAFLVMTQPVDDEIGQAGHNHCGPLHGLIDQMIVDMEGCVPFERITEWRETFLEEE